jgi:hypothetical protein
MGAVGVSPRELTLYCQRRADQAVQPSGDMGGGRDEGASAPCRRAAPENPCPDCGTAELTNGREVCQACGLLRILSSRDAQPPSGPVSSQIGAGS